MKIANLVCSRRISGAEWAGVDVKVFKLVKKWLDRVKHRHAVLRGLDVPEPFEMKKKMQIQVCLPWPS